MGAGDKFGVFDAMGGSVSRGGIGSAVDTAQGPAHNSSLMFGPGARIANGLFPCATWCGASAGRYHGRLNHWHEV
jgi:hypothetical protein